MERFLNCRFMAAFLIITAVMLAWAGSLSISGTPRVSTHGQRLGPLAPQMPENRLLVSQQEIISNNYARLPLSFEANQGQTGHQVKFLSRGQGYTLFLTPTQSVFVLRKQPNRNRFTNRSKVESDKREKTVTTVVRMKLIEANPSPEVLGLDELPQKSNYFIGNDPPNWSTNVPNYGRVQYKGVYPGVNLIYYGNQRQLEYDFIVAPGADPKAIRLGIQGAEKAFINAQGELILLTGAGVVYLNEPRVYQETEGARRWVTGRYVLKGTREVGFEVGAYDESKPLFIDPVLTYSTYLGGSGDDEGYGIAVDTFGNAYVTGQTVSTDFPKVNPLQPTSVQVSRGGGTAFVAKLNSAGSALVYSTYLGGSSGELGLAIAVDHVGNAYVTGGTNSTDFPTMNPLQTAKAGGCDAFVTKLNPEGSALIYSTYLGGSDFDQGNSIAVDDVGNAYVTGETRSTNFLTASPLQGSLKGSRSAFVAKLNAAGSALVYSTYLGGSNVDVGGGIAIDHARNAYVTGVTCSADFPQASPLQPALAGGCNAFVTKVNRTGSALVYSTYLGGSGGDQGSAIATDDVGNAYLTGRTCSIDFPTVNPLQPATAGVSCTAFVAKLNRTASALVYSTYLGGSRFNEGRGIATDHVGNAYVVGTTASTDFPTVNPLQATNAGGVDAFVTKLNPTGTALVYSTYLGGDGDDNGFAIATDNLGNAYVTGTTNSSNFPTKNPIQSANGGNQKLDAFVTKIQSTVGFGGPQ